MLDISAIEKHLQQTIFAGKLHYFEHIDSTSSTAAVEALAGAPEGATYIAGEQTAGRGRGGHSWHSEPCAGIYLSVVLRPRLQPSDILWISLLAGLAVRTAVEEMTDLAPDLRWPNDLLLGKKKFCGILAEMNSQGESTARSVILGIGINVNHASFSPELASIATSLRIEAEREWPREPLIAAVLLALHREYGALTADASTSSVGASIRSRFEAVSSYARSKHVHVEESGGYTGVTDGLDERGFLRVRTEAGLRTVLSGSVREIIPV